MPEDKLQRLGRLVRTARGSCNLTQQELADQTCVGLKTIQQIEKGKMNPSYEILYPIINRLGISTDLLFGEEMTEDEADVQHFLGKLRACTPQNRKVLIHTLDFLSEELLKTQHKEE